MNDEPEIFAPMPEMPKAISQAVFGTAREERPDPFLASIADIPNPWIKKTDSDNDKRLDFIDEDEEEKSLRQPLEVLDKLFRPAAPVRITARLGELRTLPSEDPDEAEYFCPVKKLFFADLNAVTPTAPSNQFTKRATVPAPEVEEPKIKIDNVNLEKSFGGLDTVNEQLESGLQEALDQATEDCLPSSEDESTFDFFRRVDARLQALGHRPILSVPTWTTY